MSCVGWNGGGTLTYLVAASHVSAQRLCACTFPIPTCQPAGWMARAVVNVDV